MKNILSILLLVIPQLVFGGRVGPSRSIANTYYIGIVNASEHSCLSAINEELKHDSYNIKIIPKIEGSAWEFAKLNKLDFLVYLNSRNIILLVGKTGHERKYNTEESDYFCQPIIFAIHNLTVKKKLFDSENFTFEDLKTEGEKLYREHEMAEALEYFEEALKLKKDDPDVFYFISQIYDWKGNDELEIEYLRKAKKINPIDGKIIIGIGNYHLERQEYNLAIENYNEVISDPDNKYPATFNLGLIAELSNNHDEAIEFFSSIPKDNHLYGKAQRRISEIKSAKNDFMVYSAILGGVFLLVMFFLFFRKRQNKNRAIRISIQPGSLDFIKKEIGKGNIEGAISIIRSSTRPGNKELNKLILQLESRWNQLKRQEMKDIIGERELQIQKNKITNSLLELIK